MPFKKFFGRWFTMCHGQPGRNDEDLDRTAMENATNSHAVPTCRQSRPRNIVGIGQKVHDAKCRLDVTLEAVRKLDAMLLKERSRAIRRRRYRDDDFTEDTHSTPTIEMEKLRTFFARQARLQAAELEELKSMRLHYFHRRSASSE